MTVDPKFLPFIHPYHPWTPLEIAKTAFNTVFVLPIRIVVILITMSIGAFMAFITHSSDTRLMNQPGWRRSVRVFSCNVFGLVLRHGFAFHSVTVIGEPKLDSGITVISNHVSVLDILLLLELLTPAFVAKSGVKKVPFVGYVADRLGCVFVERDAKPGTAQTTTALMERQRTYRYPCDGAAPVVVFPEGTTSNGATIRFLPVYTPSAAECADAALYASNVRRAMAAASALPTCESTLADKLELHAQIKNGTYEWWRLWADTNQAGTAGKKSKIE